MAKAGEQEGGVGIVIDDSAELPLGLFRVPRCYQQDLSGVLIPHGLILDRIQQLAHEIHAQIGDKPLTMLCVLKGSFRFFSDLVQRLSEVRSQCTSPIQVDFIRAQSYSDQASTGQLTVDGLAALEKNNGFRGKQVLLVDDIIDTGLTIRRLASEIGQRVGSASGGRVWSVLLVSKRTALRETADGRRPDFVAFSIPDKFVVGYGMDYNQMFRDLSHICVINATGIEKYKMMTNGNGI